MWCRRVRWRSVTTPVAALVYAGPAPLAGRPLQLAVSRYDRAMRTIAVRVLAAATVAMVGACSERAESPPPDSKAVSIRTPDGVRLNVIEAGSAPDVAVLSHGATGTKEDFYGLATSFVRDGWRAIAYDARGVGDSAGEEDFSARDIDLRAVVGYARRSGAQTIVLAGGSLGAALSLSMAQELHADAIVSLSAPQTTYDAIGAARKIGASIPAFVAAAVDNAPYPDDARAVADALDVEPVIVGGQGHGTGMLSDHPDLMARIVRFADQAVGRTGQPSSS
jgi:alpha-beta hydrolase superfamily lysophospholipase